MASLTRPRTWIAATALLALIALAPIPVARAADVKIKGVSDSYTLEVGGKEVQQTRITISPSLETSPEIRTTLVLRAALDGRIPQLEITGGKELNFTHSNFAVPQDITVTMKGDIAADLSTTLTLSGVGIETKTTAIKTVAATNGSSGDPVATTTSDTAPTASVAPDSANPCNDATSGNKRDCTLSERIAEKTGFVYIAWQSTRTIINLVLILALLLISFSNILRINIDTYTVKKALPNLVIGVILANASFLVIRYLADISTVAVYLFVNQTSYTTFSEFIAGTMSHVGIETLNTIGPAFGLSLVLAPIVVILLAVIAMIGIVWLAFLLYFRLVAIYLLVILSPLAFVSYGLPGFDKYFKQWWQQFIKWLFILPAMSAVFWVMYVIAVSGSGNESIAKTIILYFLFFTALALPSKMGGAVIDKASQAFKNNALSKAATDFGKMKGQQIGYRLPGVAGFQAWKELNKANAEKDIDLLKKRGKAKVLAGRAGVNQQRLAILEREAGSLEAAAVAGSTIKASETRGLLNRETLIKRDIANDFKKRKAEAQEKAHSALERYKYAIDADNKKEMEDLYRNVLNEETMTKQVERTETEQKGGEATRVMQVHRLQEDFKEAGKQMKFLEEEARTTTDKTRLGEISAELNALREDQAEREESFKALKARDNVIGERYKNFGDLAELQEAYDSKEPNINLPTKVWEAEYKLVRKSFNEGIAAQFGDDFKEKTIPALQRDVETFFKEKLGGDSEKIQAFLRGDTAKLSSLGVGENDIRSGVGMMEVYKQVLRSTNDIRHLDALKSINKLQTDYVGASNTLTQGGLTDIDSWNAATSVSQRRQAAGFMAQNIGILSGQPSGRVQKAQPTTTPPPVTPPTNAAGANPNQADLDWQNAGGFAGAGGGPGYGAGQQATPPPTPAPTQAPEDEDVFDEDEGTTT